MGIFFRNDHSVMMRSASGDVLYIIIPAYNESENIMRVVDGWYPIVERHNGNGRSRLVIIDDGSTDDTYALSCEYANARPLMEVITKKNTGHGPTVLYGYRYALHSGADYVFQTDSDGQTLPAEFEPFWKDRRSWDMIIGRRADRQDGASRVFVTRTLRQVIRLTFGIDCPDANTPFRLMKAVSLAKILPMIPADAELANVLVTVAFIKTGKKVEYRKITFRPRQGGENSMNMQKIIRVGERTIRDFTRINRKWKNNGSTQ